jgi:cellulose synthase (UDP-forming)
VLAIGQAPETVDGFFRQQFRWASGGYEVLFKRNPILSRTLTLDQKLQYLHTTLFFLSGFSVCIFYMLPLLYVYFGWKPLLVENGAASWMAHFLPYGILLYATTIHLMGRLPRWRTFVMGLGAFPAHIFACIGALTGMRIKWHASGVVQSNIDRIKSIMFHLLFLLLTIGAIPVLILSERNTMMIFFMTAWLSWNGLLLLSLCRRAFPRDQAEPSAAYVPSPALS